MPRRIACALAFAAAATALVWAGWPGAAADPATLINRVDVIATVVLLAALPWAVRRVCGPASGSWLARIVRIGGYLIVFALVLVKAHVELLEFASPAGRPVLPGVWTGEVVFLAVLAVYVTGLLAVTAARPPAAPVALAVGTAAGAGAGVVMAALPPVGSPLHVATAWRIVLWDAARVLALLLVMGVIIAAGLAAARRARGRGSGLPLADTRARQGVWAGLCAGAAAALVASVLGIGTIALLPHDLHRLVWALPSRYVPLSTGYQFEAGVTGSAAGHLPHYGNRLTMGLPGRRSAVPAPAVPAPAFCSSRPRDSRPPSLCRARPPHLPPSPVYEFEVAVTDSVAGHLLVLVFFPVLGAGLGAWGGLYGAGRPRRPGGGGGGEKPPDPVPPPPTGGARAGEDPFPAILRGGYLRELPATEGLTPAPADEPAIGQPVGSPGLNRQP
jgi:hypothetical protein